MKNKRNNPKEEIAISGSALLSLGVILYSIYKVGSLLSNKNFKTVSAGVRG